MIKWLDTLGRVSSIRAGFGIMEERGSPFEEWMMSEEMKLIDLFGKNDLKNKVYLVRDNGTPIYVGMAGKQCVTNRMSRHINDVFTKEKGSLFSQHLFEHHPDYFDWDVSVYSIDDVKKESGGDFSCISCAERAMYRLLCEQDQKPVANARKPSKKCTCNN
ncbi:MAG: hypothetical protein V7731_16180 [Amphritea sp.]